MALVIHMGPYPYDIMTYKKYFNSTSVITLKWQDIITNRKKKEWLVTMLKINEKSIISRTKRKNI